MGVLPLLISFLIPDNTVFTELRLLLISFIEFIVFSSEVPGVILSNLVKNSDKVVDIDNKLFT